MKITKALYQKSILLSTCPIKLIQLCKNMLQYIATQQGILKEVLMLQGVYIAYRKDNTPYYRSSIHYNGKHVSLGSFDTEEKAHEAYEEASRIYKSKDITIDNFSSKEFLLSDDKIVTIINHRDNKIYIKTPIYLRQGYFSYFLTRNRELKFSNDDLFYYSSHRILTRKGHLYVNDFGMQYNILSRFGIKNYAVLGNDYTFANGDKNDYRYANVIVVNKYHGVHKITYKNKEQHQVKIHFNGDYLIGRYDSEEEAAIAYNKAVDYARDKGVKKNYIDNYVPDMASDEYKRIYDSIKLPKKYTDYIDELS